MARREVWSMGEAHLVGVPTYIGTNKYVVLARNDVGKILMATTIIADPTSETGAGFAKGCLLIKSNAATGTKGLYENQGSVSTASFNKIGDITAAEIGSGAVTSAKIATSAVLTTRIGDTQVTVGKIGSGAVTSAKIGTSAVLTSRIADTAVTVGKIGSGAVTSAKLGTSAVLTSRVADSGITSAKLASGSVIAGRIGSGAVTSAKLGTSAVLTTRIGDTAVTEGKLGAASVAAAKLKIATKAVTISSAATSGSSATDLTCSGGTIIGYYPTSDAQTSTAHIKAVTIPVSGQAKVLLTLAANHAAVFNVVISKA